jgi:uncharacterized protein (TIGR03067 family)
MTRRILLTLLAGMALAADDPKKGASAGDQEKLQGAWYLVESKTSEGGVPTDPAGPGGGPPALAFVGDKLELWGVKAGSFTVDAAKRPKAMDWQITPLAKHGGLNLGIYELDGPKLTICTAKPGKPRPTDFSAKKGSGRELCVYLRTRP